MLNGKVYVVVTPDLVNSVNRSSRALAFNPFIAQLGKRITGHDEATGRIIQHNLNGEYGPGYVPEIHDGSIKALAEPSSINSISFNMLREISKLKQDTEINLFSWIRQTFTRCGTTAIYGPDNPLAQDGQGLAEAFWFVQSVYTSVGVKSKLTHYIRDFDRDLNLLMVDVFPKLLAPKADLARSRLGRGFQRYFEQYRPGVTESSALTHTRYCINSKYSLSPWNAARLEVGVLLGVLANIIPAIFYTIVHVYHDRELLYQIRDELETTSVIKSDRDGTIRTLKIVTMREKCNLLHATFKEVLRHHALGSSARYVREDVMLDNKYLLKKGMVVQMPMAVLHKDRAAWGDDASSFRPRRFLKDGTGVTLGKGDFKPTFPAFRPFGGGTSLCPGRHLATTETMALAAYMVLRYSMEPAGGGAWEIPKSKQENLATNVFPPEHDIRVRLGKREGYEDVQWDFSMS
ncbi:MAG: hypothetical protein LQ338_003451 [Usnochroma carphineum]|nr:MAG: hypothetical protein LQ338_003451 [Usnochroma carphineum]